MNPLKGVTVVCLESLTPRCAAIPAEPMEEMASDAPSKIQPMNLAKPKGRASKMIMGMVTAMIRRSPIQKVCMGVLSTRIWAREINAGNNSHKAVSMAGNAMPMINKMKKIAEISAIGFFLFMLRYRVYRNERGKVAGFLLTTKDTKVKRKRRGVSASFWERRKNNLGIRNFFERILK